MTLYFAAQETNLNIAFPPSVIAITDDNFFRRFAISTLEGIEQDKDEEILAEMSKIKKSPHIVKPTGQRRQVQGLSQPNDKKEDKPINIQAKVE